ncbi:MAG TPA: CoA-binding protein [Niabella sp.]|jgi:predicted CoA-binding protein|nr:CoA-binding protein [Chitinophagaceae bacterium]HRN48760.1 CoA-binding protein [Niabella sp.]HRO84380.1 CoA-binding protein [Niabella sp.]HUN03172.1 CoA-binding protein [Niabella sp.]
MKNKKTLVLGASENPTRYSNMAIKKLREYGHDVVAIGRRTGKVLDVEIIKHTPYFSNIDTITVYMNERNQAEYEAYMLSLNPKRIIFNPGAENEQFFEKTVISAIQPIEACTLVMLSTGQY